MAHFKGKINTPSFAIMKSSRSKFKMAIWSLYPRTTNLIFQLYRYSQLCIVEWEIQF